MGVEKSSRGIKQSPGLKSGDLLTGTYQPITVELGEPLGKGGTAQVFETTEGRAVKVFGFSDQSASTLNQALPVHEAEMQAELGDRPDLVVPIHFFDIAQNGERNPYIVMERGGSNIYKLAKNKKIPPDQILPILIQSAQTLLLLHDRDIVYRDVKPQNFLDGEQGVRLIDFGTAVHVDGPDIAPPGIILGTPSYLPPERFIAGQENPLSDQYSWGVMGYQLLTGGRHPYFVDKLPEGIKLEELYKMLTDGTFRPLTQLQSGKITVLREELEPVIAVAVSKNKDKRYRDFSEVIEELEYVRVRTEARMSHEPSTHVDLGPKVISVFKWWKNRHPDEQPTVVAPK